MRILIATPTGGSIFPDTYRSIQQCQKYTMNKLGEFPDWDFSAGYDVATNRNKIVQMVVDRGYEAVLFVDNDMVIQPETIEYFLEDDVDVCLGWYAHRTNSRIWDGTTSICRLGEWNYTDQYKKDEVNKLREEGTTVFQIHGGGMGCAFIKTDVFRQLVYPWFDWVNYPDSHRGLLSEDLYLCEQCKKAGIPIYSDSRVGPHHIFRIPVGVLD